MAWVVGWFGFVLQLELTADGELHWRKAFSTGQIPLWQLHQIVSLRLPFLYLVRHDGGHKLVFAPDVRRLNAAIQNHDGDR